MSFECPSCGCATSRLIIFNDPKRLGCDSCGIPKARHSNVNLGQIASYYVKRDGSTGKMTTGKRWEIEHRMTTPEGNVINSKTKRDTQY